MELAALQAEFDALQSDPSLELEINLQGREKALDYIRFVGEIAQVRKDAGVVTLHQNALALQAHLEQINVQLFGRMRSEIRTGAYTRQTLRQKFNHFTTYIPGDQGQAHIGYDGLDLLLSGLFEFEPPPQARQPLSTEMVHYEPTPARAILDLIDRLSLGTDDVFYDLGAGLGQIAMLVYLLTGSKTKGIELETSFCTYAQVCAQQLGLAQIEFINADAQFANYADGTVFYLFTPFKGALLQTVLGRLAQEAQTRPIKVCTFGPCTLAVARQSWLRSLDGNTNHEFKLAIFESR
ncbi:hypothetical protein BH10CHL1_BH10CHL1_25010 [soil metagenome]